MYKKTTTVEEYFDTAPPAAPMPQSMAAPHPRAMKPVLRLDVPLMIRLFEYAKEEAKSDSELHVMVERMAELCEYGEVLEMEDYEEIVEITMPPTPAPDTRVITSA